ncbi:MAG: hypothetical protein ABH823_03325 [bacterium]
MKKLPRLIVCLSVLCLFSTICYGQGKDLVINGENVTYDQSRHLVEGRGSVEVIYKGVTVHAQHVIYQTEDEQVQADGGFDLRYNGILVSGETLNYNVVSREGRATDFSFAFDGVKTTGREIILGSEKFILKNATFTSCDLPGAHYQVTASEITLYPEYGWLVAYWGWFKINGVPLVPVPTYIYDINASSRGEKNLPPFPEVGSNDEDGVYINQRLAWSLRREFSGTYSLSYAEKKGFGGGARADYIFRENNRGNFRMYGNAVDGPVGGLTHFLYFGQPVADQPDNQLHLFSPVANRNVEFETNLAYRERINYEKVSYLPNLVLRLSKGKFFWDQAKHDVELGWGDISEFATLRTRRAYGKVKLSWDFPEITLGDITPNLEVDARFYGQGGKWEKTAFGLELAKEISPSTSLGLGYLHYFSIVGQSPFNFEMYRFNPADRLQSNILTMVGETGFGLGTSYFLDTWQPEDIDYSVLLRRHCYDLELKYRSMRREFQIGVSLVD